jgi:hypothetical protein
LSKIKIKKKWPKGVGVVGVMNVEGEWSEISGEGKMGQWGKNNGR